MDPDRSSFIPIQNSKHKQQQLLQLSNNSTTSNHPPAAIWSNMHDWMEQSRKQWDDEMAQLKSQFFCRKPVDVATGGGRTSNDGNKNVQEKMNINSKFYETGKGGKVFCVTFDVSQFEPEEINVRTQGHCLSVQAKHEERRENRSVSREFNRQIDIPVSINPKSLRCILNEDGMLQVEADLPSTASSLESIFYDIDGLTTRDRLYPTTQIDEDDEQTCISNGSLDDAVAFGGWPTATTRAANVRSPPALDEPWGRSSVLGTASNGTLMGPSVTGGSTVDYERSMLGRPTTTVNNGRMFDGRSTNNGTARGILETSYNGPSSQRALGGGLTTWTGFRQGQPMEDAVDRPDVFQVTIEIGTEFDPDELMVKTVDRKLIVQAQKKRQLGLHPSLHLSKAAREREIYKEFDLPDEVDPSMITANLTSDGSLIIETAAL